MGEQLSVTADGVLGAGVGGHDARRTAVRALAAVTRYAQWRSRDPGVRPHLEGCDPAGARALAEQALREQAGTEQALREQAGTEQAGTSQASQAGTSQAGTGQRAPDDVVASLLGCYGVHLWPSETVADADAAVAAAERLGWPVALKFADEHLRDRRDLGGVRLDIADADELRTDLAAMTERLVGAGEPVPDPGHAFVVQPMAPAGVPVVVRTIEDPLFGPIVSFGMAGDASELLGDVAHRIPPLTDVDVADLVRSVRAAPRLFGYRGTPALDVAALEALIVAVSQLADDVPEVAQLELGPVVVAQQGIAVLSADVRLARPSGRTDAGGRRALR